MNRWITTLREIREKIVDTIKRDQNEVIKGQTKPIRAFISYSHDSRHHYNLVKDLSDRLSREGISCIFDQYLDNDGPEEGWASWSEKNILGADYIFIVCTKGYYSRTRGEIEEDIGP